MKIIADSISMEELERMAAELFGDMVKAVVDVDLELVALDAELHSDLEALLLEAGSKQDRLWGINLYPAAAQDDFVEFDSLINVRPSRSNRSRGVEDPGIRKRIIEIVEKRIKK